MKNAPFIIKPLVIATLFVSLGALVACGESTDQANNNEQSINDQPTPKPLGSNALVKAGSDDAFLAYYKTGLNANQQQLKKSTTVEQTVADSDSGSPASPGNASSDGQSGFGVSSTNLIEKGVDEADFVKQNNSHIYTTTSDKNSNGINVFAKPNTKKIASVKLPMQDGNVGRFKGFFLKADNLYSLRQASYANWQFNDTYAYNNGKIALDVVNVATPATPAITQNYIWDGDYKTARRINNNIYVISSSSVQDPWVCYAEDVVVDANLDVGTAGDALYRPACNTPKPLTKEQLIQRMPVDVNGNKIKPADCLIPSDYNKDSKLNGNITLITKIDLNDDTNHKTTCVAGSAQNIYMSQKALYLAGQDYHYEGDDTIIPLQTTTDASAVVEDVAVKAHTLISKFDLNDDGVKYAGTGKVAGYINWNAPSFSMNEYNDVLRVVTTAQSWQNGSGIVANMVHTLKPADDKLELELVARLPNVVRPKSIGKPNERVQGIRFMGDSGYIVTFRRTDPLYKINLSTPSDPFVQGELEMPGYSAYLQQLNDKYLLGVGYMADDTGRITGLQTNVFDVSGNDPVMVDNKVYETKANITLPVASDSRAITTLSNGSITKVAVPYKTTTYDRVNGSDYRTNALEYEVDLNTGLFVKDVNRNLISSNAYSYNYFNKMDRVLMDGNETYYSMFDGSLIRYLWNELPD